MTKPRLATLWLGGCSGCHMSLLDLDERLLELLARVDLVYGPLVDAKEYPEGVDAALVEGAVANEEHLVLLRRVRERTRTLVALGDCAVTGNVTALRNAITGGVDSVLDRVYRDGALLHPAIPAAPGILPPLLDRVLPLHHVVKVDGFLPGCPPAPALLLELLSSVLGGGASPPDALRGRLRFG